MKNDLASALAQGDQTPVVLKVQGTQQFMGKEIPVIEGGFGEGEKVVLAKTISEIHDVELKKVNELINKNLDEFDMGIDLLNLKDGSNLEVLAKDLGFITSNRQEYCYILSEQGYMALVNLMRTEKAKGLRKQFRREYFTLRQAVKQQSMSMEEIMIYQLEEQKKIKQQLNQINTNALTAVNTAEEVRNILDNQMTINTTQQAKIKDAVSRRVSERLDRCAEFDFGFDISDHKAKFYSNLWNDLKRRFGVARYGDILHIDFEDALKFVQSWVEPADIR